MVEKSQKTKTTVVDSSDDQSNRKGKAIPIVIDLDSSSDQVIKKKPKKINLEASLDTDIKEIESKK